MSKRRLNDFAESKENTVQDVDSDISNSENEYDSENDVTYHPAIKKMYKFNDYKVQMKNLRSNETNLPVENEHAYSCFPLFTSVRNNRYVADNKNSSDGSCESEENNLNARRISERSTSSESLKSKGKSTNWTINSQNVRSKRQPKCFNKNAVMARMNRQRKKEYVNKLEENIASLKESNINLKTKLNEQQEEVNSLKNEVQYLKSVLSNSKEIGSLLRKITSGDEKKFKVTSSVLRIPSSQNDSLSDNEVLKGTDECSSNYYSDNPGLVSPGSSDDCNFFKFSNTLLNDDFNDVSLFTPSDGNDLDWLLSSNYDSSKMDKMLDCDVLPSEFSDFETNNPFGVCLHVANKQVSLEFCATCSRNASTVFNSDISIVK